VGPDDARLREVFDIVEHHVEGRWGVPVRITDVPNPFTGDLDGAEIQVDYDLAIDEAVFILAHLFGHTVQWNVSAEARELGMLRPGPWSDAELARLHEYEREACEYSVQLFHDARVLDLDAWLSDFAACDWAYLEHFYRTGEKLAFRSFWRDGQPLLAARAIPMFSPVVWRSRASGIVV
jgi:hypothetical protein